MTALIDGDLELLLVEFLDGDEGAGVGNQDHRAAGGDGETEASSK